MKSFISFDKNIYYEAPDRLNQNDIEVPQRPTPDHLYINGSWIDKNILQMNQLHSNPPTSIPAQQSNQANLGDLVNVIKQLQSINAGSMGTTADQTSSKKDSPMSNFISEKFTWKDLITVLYFAGGIVGLWMHMNERIIVLEQKVVSIEKGNAELQSSFKDFIVKNENQLKGIDSKISDLQQMVITRISASPSKH